MEAERLNQPSTGRFFRIFLGWICFRKGVTFLWQLFQLIIYPGFSVFHFRHRRFLGHRQDFGFLRFFCHHRFSGHRQDIGFCWFCHRRFLKHRQNIGFFWSFVHCCFNNDGRILISKFKIEVD